ncbi:MAG: molybdenum cofactor biosynthesis protein MoaE [Candidatus Hadarchaeia archaeon]
MAKGKVLNKEESDLLGTLKSFKRDPHRETGAIGVFIGIVRSSAKNGGKVESLEYECAEDTEEKLEELARDVEESNEEIQNLEIYHVVDDLDPGEDIVYVLAEGSHRKSVFDSLSSTMDRIKKEVPIWKKEVSKEDEYWIHEVE